MRFCGSFGPDRATVRAVFAEKTGLLDGFEDLARPENRAQSHGLAGKRIGSAFLAIDDANGGSNCQTGAA